MFQELVLFERLKNRSFFARQAAKRLTSRKAVLMKKELAILGVFGTIL